MLSTILLGIIALFIPPFPVAVRRGCGSDLLLNLLLTLLCWIPGVAHAFYILIRYPGKDKRQRNRSYSSSSKGTTHRRSSSHAWSRSRSTGRPRSRSHDRHVYPRYDRREYIEPPPQMGSYRDPPYYSHPPTMPPERPMYVYN